MNNRRTIEIDGWKVKVQTPAGSASHPVLLLLHGWTGDENAMWVFESRLPQDSMLIAPRGLYTTPLGGYGWHPHRVNYWPWVDDFNPAIEALRAILNNEQFPEGDFARLGIMGFSQGAALAFALALLYPAEVGSLAGLSGFLPEGAQALARNRPLIDKRIFLAHGTQDELVPVERARQAVNTLEEAGAQVTYCEDDVGHKLSATCFDGLERFLSG